MCLFSNRIHWLFEPFKTITFDQYLITMGIIKVAIADDHKIFRKGVILSLRPFTNIKFVQEAENGDDLTQWACPVRTRCNVNGPAYAR